MGKQYDYGAVPLVEVDGDVDDAYCAKYALPDNPTFIDFFFYPYRFSISCFVFLNQSKT